MILSYIILKEKHLWVECYLIPAKAHKAGVIPGYIPAGNYVGFKVRRPVYCIGTTGIAPC